MYSIRSWDSVRWLQEPPNEKFTNDTNSDLTGKLPKNEGVNASDDVRSQPRKFCQINQCIGSISCIKGKYYLILNEINDDSYL